MAAESRSGAPSQIAICIPVRNEASALPKLFEALQRLERDQDQQSHICLFLDGCTDETAALASIYRASSPYRVWIEEVPPSPANAGRARHRAMMLGAEALARLGGLLLTTDADSVPSPDWLGAMSAGLQQADVVAGRVVRDETRICPLQDRIESYYDTLFALRRFLDPVPWEAARTHHHASGANLGIRANAYRAIGGFLPLSSGEDSRLVDDAARAGLRVRRDAASLVHTSDRRHGRAEGGLAHALLDLDRGDANGISVAHPRDATWQYRMHASARTAYDEEKFHSLGAMIGLSRDHVRGVARDCPNAEAFAMRVVPAPLGGMGHVPLPRAEAELAEMVGKRRAA